MKKPFLPPDQAARDTILHDLDRTLLVEAAAGTGKTTSMVGRLVNLLSEGKCEARCLAAITFTKKAASELRDRFQAELASAATQATGPQGDRLRQAASELDQAFIGTIHSFCARLLRERPVEAGIDLAFEELDDEEDGLLRVRAWQEFVARVHATEDPILGHLEELGLTLSDLENAFLDFAQYPDVENWPCDPVDKPDFASIRKALVKYSRHMQARVSGLKSEVKSKNLYWLYHRLPRLIRWRNIDRPAELMSLLELFSGKLDESPYKNWDAAENSKSGRAVAEEERDRFLTFQERVVAPNLIQWRVCRYPLVLEVLQSARLLYDEFRLQSGCLNYQDLLMKAAALLKDKPAIRRYFRRRFSHLLVDEFQDTDPVQAEVVLFLTAGDPDEQDWTKCRPVPGALFVVGDPKQSIYRFRRADIVTYNEVKRIIRESQGGVVELSTNFRTVPSVIEAVNSVFSASFRSFESEHSPQYIPLQPGREGDPSVPLSGVRLLWEEAESKETANPVREREADLIARFIRAAIDEGWAVARTPKELSRGVSPAANPGDFMILTYHRRTLEVYSRKLEEYGIPFEVTGGKGGSGMELLRLLHGVLACLADPEDPIALVRILRGEWFGASDEDLLRFRLAGGQFRFLDPLLQTDSRTPSEVFELFRNAFHRLRRYSRWVDRYPPSVVAEKVATDFGLLPMTTLQPGANLAVGSFYKVLEMARAGTSTQSSFADFVEFLRRVVEGEVDYDGLTAQPRVGPAVRLMNLHKSKGLESPVVFLADPSGKGDHEPKLHIDRKGDCAKGYLRILGKPRGEFVPGPLLAHPSDWNRWAESEKLFLEAEYQRLLYVAATRAGSQLVVSNMKVSRAKNYWEPLAEGLKVSPSKIGFLADPGVRRKTEEPKKAPLRFDPSVDSKGLADRWAAVLSPSYRVEVAKQAHLQGPVHETSHSDLGREWGTAIHRLLETQGKDTVTDLDSLAHSVFDELDLDPLLIPVALELVDQVTRSEIWNRAQIARRRFVEVPFSRTETPPESPAGPAVVINGVIDLVFEENAGWVIVDYKTDRHPESHLPHLVEQYSGQVRNYVKAWTLMTGEKVAEAGLFFTHLHQYRTLDLRDLQ